MAPSTAATLKAPMFLVCAVSSTRAHMSDSEIADTASTGFQQGPGTPQSDHVPDPSPEFLSKPSRDLDEETLAEEQQHEARKVEPRKGGYDSRIEQILYEYPDMEIQIVHAGKNTESGGGYISYTIRTGVCCSATDLGLFADSRQGPGSQAQIL